jgi:ABC-type multidrug transport system permease subunit
LSATLKPFLNRNYYRWLRTWWKMLFLATVYKTGAIVIIHSVCVFVCATVCLSVCVSVTKVYCGQTITDRPIVTVGDY